MGKVIGRLPVVYDPSTRRVTVERSAEFVETQIFQRLDDLAHGQPLHLTLTVEPERKGRSTQQNRLFCTVLRVVSLHCKSRKEPEHTGTLRLLYCPAATSGTLFPTNSLNVPAGQFSFCYPWHCWGLHPGGTTE